MSKRAAPARQRRFRNPAEFGRGIGTPDRTLSVLGIDVAHQWSNSQAKQREREWVADEIENDEPTARAADVADHGNQIIVRKMMAEVHTVRYICNRQAVAACVGPHDRDRRRNCRMRIDFRPNYIHAKANSHFVQHETGRASDIEDSPHRQSIAAYRANYATRVAQPAMNSGDVPIRVRNKFFCNSLSIEDFAVRVSDHPA
jgi:hypothetical protein